MKFMICRTMQLLVLFSVYILINANPAAKHAHSHNNLNQERVQDGSYNPRDQGHVSEDGEHHSEFDHEAILGSIKEAEEFDKLSPDESKRRLAILLTKMDLNNDGQIDRQELHAWILRSFRMLSEEEAKERFEETDENGDGLITWTEYLSDYYGIESDEDHLKRPFDSKESEDQLIGDDKLMFNAADKNHDQKLNATEFVAFSHPEEHPEMLPIILQQTLRDKDKNNDGFIDFQEFLGERGISHDKDWLMVEKDKFDHEYDKDGDGKLNGNEILSWVVPSNDEIAEEEVNHLFAASDDDHNNVLSFEEILEHHDTFVGSEATDYGDHLNNIHTFDDEL